MRLSPNEIAAHRRETQCHSPARRAAWPYRAGFAGHQRGFTLIELIITIVLVGILAVVVAPRFFGNNAFLSRGFADQVQTSLRYAQKLAIAQRRSVCVKLDSNRIALFAPTCSVTPLAFPTGETAIDAPNGVTITSGVPVAITFDAKGATGTKRSIAVGSTSIIVEAETGYVHSP